MGWGRGRSKSLPWKKHPLLFYCSGALHEHGSSSSGFNKDANFIPSSSINIKKRCSIIGGQWLCYSLSSFVFVLGFWSSQAQLPATLLCLPGVRGCLWLSLPLPGKEVALAHVICIMIINCLQWDFFFLPYKESTLFLLPLIKREWNK